MRVVIIGGGELGRMLAKQLDTDYNEVTLLDENSHSIERATAQELSASSVADVRDVDPLANLDLDIMSVVAVATEDDSTNLLIAQLVKSRFDIERIIVRINDPQNRPAFEDLGVEIEAVCASQILSHALAKTVNNAV